MTMLSAKQLVCIDIGKSFIVGGFTIAVTGTDVISSPPVVYLTQNGLKFRAGIRVGDSTLAGQLTIASISKTGACFDVAVFLGFCTSKTVAAGDTISLAGYTLHISGISIIGIVSGYVTDSSGAFVGNGTPTTPAALVTGIIEFYPNNTSPDLGIQIINIDTSKLFPTATIQMCTASTSSGTGTGVSVPPPPPPSPPPEITPTPGPVLDTCALPQPSLNFYSMISGLISYLACILKNIIAYLEWIVTNLGNLIPQILAFLVYVLSLQWLRDLTHQFFKDLDIWLSAKFGIDPALPFWEELVKKALGWIGGVLDAAAENRMKIRGWK